MKFDFRKLILTKDAYISGTLYFLLTVLLHWRTKPDLGILFYLVGSIIGMHMLEFVENSFKFEANTFRSALMQIVLIPLSLFVITSSGNPISKGIVLLLNLRLFELQRIEYAKTGNLTNWFGSNADMNSHTYKIYLYLIGGMLGLETLVFIFS
jgi:hypothetical protein